MYLKTEIYEPIVLHVFHSEKPRLSPYNDYVSEQIRK
jgi:hypothetical protein